MKMIRKPELFAMVGLRDRAIREMEYAGEFPKRVVLNPKGGRAVAWIQAEVEEFLRKRAEDREAA